ncbi:HAD-superfamily hydrolase, subfamily IIB [Austwickia chelonae]|uniref:Hydrolase n=1 Tax=Austwickia chelonae NBRC 105200 TaxID=1184607 RepID=K6VAB3_9MICO|nr:HAD hydrolase family protein [Austwickia chelonae]GAB79173.1 hypothetical protein AUCHE_20_00450 [Austwickia chelonae NBRC 105200]SEW42929.1 HAD-superfamily hydrolase, subfamily IIB [Austwickia chelonae]
MNDALKTLRLAMLDVDGTLRDESGWKPSAARLIEALHDAGLVVALCSGRNTESLHGSADEFRQISLVAPCSGSLVQARTDDGWSTLANRSISPETVSWIAEQTAEADMELWAYTDGSWIVESVNERVTAESHYVGAQATVGSFTDRDDIVKMLAFPLSRRQRQVLERIDAQRDLAVVQSYPGYFDIVRAEAAATKGGDILTEHLGIGWDQVVAMGDGENDLGMLSKAGVAMAMAPLRSTLLDPTGTDRRRFDCPDLATAIDHLAGLGVIAAG